MNIWIYLHLSVCLFVFILTYCFHNYKTDDFYLSYMWPPRSCIWCLDIFKQRFFPSPFTSQYPVYLEQNTFNFNPGIMSWNIFFSHQTYWISGDFLLWVRWLRGFWVKGVMGGEELGSAVIAIHSERCSHRMVITCMEQQHQKSRGTKRSMVGRPR